MLVEPLSKVTMVKWKKALDDNFNYWSFSPLKILNLNNNLKNKNIKWQTNIAYKHNKHLIAQRQQMSIYCLAALFYLSFCHSSSTFSQLIFFSKHLTLDFGWRRQSIQFTVNKVVNRLCSESTPSVFAHYNSVNGHWAQRWISCWAAAAAAAAAPHR